MMLRTVTAVLFLIGSPRTGESQVVLEQPVVGVIGVQTSVSVPDGGSALLGRVDRAKDARSRYGFSPWGSSRGREVSRSNLDVRVTIHDFEAMDQWLLSQPREPDDRFGRKMTAGARSQLRGTRTVGNKPVPASASVTNSTASIPMASIPSQSRVSVPVRQAARKQSTPAVEGTPGGRLIALGDAALNRSDRTGALRYYQSARRLGAGEADERIRLLLESQPE